MQPEISRRCLSCGAAVRAGSRFCHQCGKGLGAEAAPSVVSEERPAEPEPARVKEPPPTGEWTPPTKEFAAFEQPPATRPLTPAESVPDAPDAEEVEPEAARAGDLRGRVARVREGTKARVGRMREEAIVVLEETPDDSGLRFVIAAVALFAVFLFVLFLSTTLLR